MPGISLQNVLLHAQTLTEGGRIPHAIGYLQQYRRSFALDPYFNALLGTLLGASQNFSAAAGCLELAWRGGAQRSDVLLKLAICLANTGQAARAEKLLREGATRYPDVPAFSHELITVLRKSGRVCDAAQEAMRQWREQPANTAKARRACGELLACANVDYALLALREMYQHPATQLEAQCHMMLQLLYSDRVSPQDLVVEHRRAARLLQSRQPPLREPFTNSPEPDRPLRIGYCSQDFRNRSAGHFIESMIAAHDRERFEVYCYHHTISEDELTQRLRSHVHAWREVQGKDDYAAARMARADGIDLWIDLTGWTGAGRIGICVARAAPIQATYMGYACTTGVESVSARFVDALTDPLGHDDLATETLLRIDPCFLAYTPPHHTPAVQQGPGASDPTRPITFGSFNAYQKISATCLDHWCAVLKAVPHSRLLLKNSNLEHAQCRERLLQAFAQRGIEATRIELRPETAEKSQHLATYNHVDIALDAFPYHGTTTTIEALLMGVPVLSVVGGAHHARVGASLLHAIGQPDWCTQNATELARRASELAGDRARLRALRHELRARLLASPICDASRVTRQLEAHYRALWQAWCSEQQSHGSESVRTGVAAAEA